MKPPTRSADADVETDTAAAESADETADASAEPVAYSGMVTMEVPMRDIFTGDTTNATGTVSFTIDSNTGEVCALVSTDSVTGPLRQPYPPWLVPRAWRRCRQLRRDERRRRELRPERHRRHQ